MYIEAGQVEHVYAHTYMYIHEHMYMYMYIDMHVRKMYTNSYQAVEESLFSVLSATAWPPQSVQLRTATAPGRGWTERAHGASADNSVDKQGLLHSTGWGNTIYIHCAVSTSVF